MSENPQVSSRLKLDSTGPVSVVASPALSSAQSFNANSTSLNTVYSSGSLKPINQHVIQSSVSNALSRSFVSNTSYRIPLQVQTTTHKVINTGILPLKTNTISASAASQTISISSGSATISVSAGSNKQFTKNLPAAIVSLDAFPKIQSGDKVNNLPISSGKSQNSLTISTSVNVVNTLSSTNFTSTQPNSVSLVKPKPQQHILVAQGLRQPSRQTYVPAIPIITTQQTTNFVTQHNKPLSLQSTSRSTTSVNDSPPITIVTRPAQFVVPIRTMAAMPIRTITTQPVNTDGGRRQTIVQQPKTSINIMPPLSSIPVSDPLRTPLPMVSNAGMKTIYQVSSTSLAQADKAKLIVSQSAAAISGNVFVPVTVVSASNVQGNIAPVSGIQIPVAKVYPQQFSKQSSITITTTAATAPSSHTVATSTITVTSSSAPLRSSKLPDSRTVVPVRSIVSHTASTNTVIGNLPVTGQRVNAAQFAYWSNPYTFSQTTSVGPENRSLSGPSTSQPIRLPSNVVIIDPLRPMPSSTSLTSSESGNRTSNVGSPHIHSSVPTILRRNSPMKHDQRSSQAIAHLNSNQTKVRQIPSSTSEISVIHTTSKSTISHSNIQSGKNKPITAQNKVMFGKTTVTSNGFTSTMKLTAKTTKIISQTTTTDGKSSQFITSLANNNDIKVKNEPVLNTFHVHQPTVKILEQQSASASQILQNQYPNRGLPFSPVNDGKSHVVTQANNQQSSSYHIKANTLLANQNFRANKPTFVSPVSNRTQPHVVRPVINPSKATTTNGFQYNHVGNIPRNNPQFKLDQNSVKRNVFGNSNDRLKENSSLTSQTKDIFNHSQINHRIPGQRRPLDNDNDQNNLLVPGLSPRKRPRKQTHIVSLDPPDVEMIEDDSTDDADECEDEPQIINARHQQLQQQQQVKVSLSTTPASKLPGHIPNPTNSFRQKSPLRKSESPTPPPLMYNAVKPLSEFTDSDGVRYVLERKRPPFVMYSRLKFNWKTTANHYLCYSDIKIKEKKTTISDLKNCKTRTNGLKMGKLAQQLVDLADCEIGIMKRMEAIRDGLEDYREKILGNADNTAPDASEILTALVSPSPGSTPTQKKTPQLFKSFSLLSPICTQSNASLTPAQKKINKISEEILKTKELTQANIQRCSFISEKQGENKTLLLKALENREIVNNILSKSSKQNEHATFTLNSKRTSKKKIS